MPFSWLLLSLLAPAQVDTVVVCPPVLRAAIRPWTDYRKAQGHRIALVDGVASAEQIRQEIRQAAKDGQLRFIMLVGEADLPTKAPSNARFFSVPTHYVPAKVNVHWGSEPDIATDNWYADLDDDDVPEVAIGRLSARSPSQITAMVRKILSYEGQIAADASQAGDQWRRQINLVAGLGGFGTLLDTAIETAAKSFITDGIPAAYRTTFTHASWRSPYCPPPSLFGETALRRLDEGCLFWVYMGHGQPRELDRVQVPGGEHPILESDDLDRLQAGRGAAIALFLACYTAAYDARGDCLAEELLRRERGPVAVIGGSRVTMPYAMSVLGIELLKECFVSRRPTLGELLLHAKRNMALAPRTDERSKRLDALASLLSPAGSDLADERLEHIQLFNLLGDPLLKLTHPGELQVVAPRSARPGEAISISGTCAIDGPATVELTVRRDRLTFRPLLRESYTASPQSDDEYRRTYAAANDNRLVSVRTTVANGKFRARLDLPEQAGGDCHVRVFVQGRGGFAVGAADIHIE
ncbi:MAG TPA: C25 family cysteine peptidase [Pirellulales bacterium]|nr:C25 family cysteine peptidase [Pirellulales bacterium]